MICVSLGRTRHKMMIAEHQQLAQKGAQLVELRLDWLGNPPDLGRLLKDKPTPVVITCRRNQITISPRQLKPNESCES